MGGEVSNPLLLIDWGAASRALGNESESGDRYWIQPLPRGILMAVVDALGHGEEASAAARAAIEAMGSYAEGSVLSLIPMVKHCHQKLTHTRGVVMTLVWFNAPDETMTWLGIGNVDGVLMRGSSEAVPAVESVLLRRGVVGYQLPALQASVVPVAKGDTLVLATDGIRNGFTVGINVNDPPQRMADQILARYGKDNDDALVLVARYLGRAP
jgi:serine phosphatase RsbU (regulator of sigma subunit)